MHVLSYSFQLKLSLLSSLMSPSSSEELLPKMSSVTTFSSHSHHNNFQFTLLSLLFSAHTHSHLLRLHLKNCHQKCLQLLISAHSLIVAIFSSHSCLLHPFWRTATKSVLSYSFQLTLSISLLILSAHTLIVTIFSTRSFSSSSSSSEELSPKMSTLLISAHTLTVNSFSSHSHC